ncbi:G protein-coupled glucose receptor regulating Gpa2-domain-containing protein [Apiospora arundinis]
MEIVEAGESGNGTLFWQNDTLAPIGEPLRKGLIAVTVVSLVSFVSAGSLFTYILYKALVDFRQCRRRQRQLRERPDETRSEISLDLSLSLPIQRQIEGSPDNLIVARNNSTRSNNTTNTTTNNDNSHRATEASQTATAQICRGCQPYRNPFPFLILSILGAECNTALGFSLNLSWVLRNGIIVGTPACALQGWLNSMGILTSSISFMFMATCNYLAIVWGFRPQNKNIFLCNMLAWVFSIALVCGAIISTKNGEEFGGWYVRANAWCWVNPKYATERLWSCWAWVLFSIPYTCLLYALIFWKIYRQKPCRQLSGRVTFAGGATGNLPSGYHPAFFIYPFVYVVCTIPLAVVRLSQSMSGSGDGKQRDTDGYYCFAALMVASNGLWNTILWLTTMFISTPEDIHQAGLGTFAFMRTPEWRKFGNMVWISGPMSKGVKLGGKGGRNSHHNEGPWWWWRMGGETRLRDSASSTQGPSQEEFPHCEDNGIQMNVVTTITVEEALDREKDVQEKGTLHDQDKHEYRDRSIPPSICSDTGKPRIT